MVSEKSPGEMTGARRPSGGIIVRVGVSCPLRQILVNMKAVGVVARFGPARETSCRGLGRLSRVVWVLALFASHGCSRQPTRPRDETARAHVPSAPAVASGASLVVAPSSGSTDVASGAEKSEPSLDELSFESLPLAPPTPCSHGGQGKFIAVSRSLWTPIVAAVQKAWPEGDVYGPRLCIGAVRMRCGADFDGKPGAEVLAEISYRLPQEGVAESEHPLRPSCTSRERVPQAVVVALSTPSSERSEWTSLGIVGFSDRGVGEGGTVIRIKRFVKMPDGTIGVYARAFTPGFSAQAEVIRVYEEDGGTWRTASTRHLPDASDEESATTH